MVETMKNIIISNNYIEVVDENGENFELTRCVHHEKLCHNFYKLVVSNPAPKFSLDELKILKELLLSAMDWGDSYPKIRMYVDLYEKISEEIAINE